MTELDVFVVGGVGVDVVVRVPELPLPLHDSIHVPPIHQYAGHTGTGVALGCHHLGLRTHLVDVIGDDPEGQLVQRTCADVGLSFDYQVHSSGTRRSVNLVDATGRRLSLFDARQPAGLSVDPTLYRPALARSRHVYVAISDWARVVLDEAVDAGLPTSTDLHDWDGRNPYHQEFAYRADLVFLSTTALGDRVEETLFDVLRRGRATAAVAMSGGDGSYLALPGQPLRHRPAARPTGPVVDTNGAGDAYVTGFLSAQLAGRSWEVSMTAGSVAGAHACLTAGTHTSPITAEELEGALL